MKPAVSSKKRAILFAVLVGGFSFYWYFVPFPWLGAIMGVLTGLLTFFILSSPRMERLRRVYYVGLFVLVFVSLMAIILDMGTSTFTSWADVHEKEYYLAGQTTGTGSYPCTREVAQVLMGRATYMPGLHLWQTEFPSTLGEFGLILIPFAVTGLIFGRGFCGWICPLGGLSEGFVTGRKERWKLSMFLKKVTTKDGFSYSGLKEWVRDAKFGILAGLALLSVVLVFPLMCIFCPVMWLTAVPIFWMVIGLLVILAVVLPFMTKRRWWCLLCPVGAVFSMLNKISLFRIRIDKDKCSKCMDCVQECRMYALTPESVETSKTPDFNCIRCGRCIEVCPDDAIDLYLVKTNIKARPLFISLAIIAVVAWYAWFIILLFDILKTL